MSKTEMLFETEPAHQTGCKRPLEIPAGVVVTATFAGPHDCYRTKLCHRWAPGPAVMFAMKNPSAASLKFSDSTIAKCSQYARGWGFGALLVGNALPYRATDPGDLLRYGVDPDCSENLYALEDMAMAADLIIMAHGRLPKRLEYAGKNLAYMLKRTGKPLHALRVSPDGTPHHPLYLPLNLKPFVWEGYKSE
jgi:hypothetical protein